MSRVADNPVKILDGVTVDIEGQEVKVKLLEIDSRGKVRLSMKSVDQDSGSEIQGS